MTTLGRVTTFDDGRPERAAARYGRGLLNLDVALGAAYARLANRPLARIAGRALVSVLLTLLLAAKSNALSAAVLTISCGLQLWRTQYEEVGLSATFPEYGDYQRRTARMVPGLW